MKIDRRILTVTLLAASMLVANQASAQHVYTMFGRIISSRGALLEIPMIGEQVGNCDHFAKGHTRDPAAARSRSWAPACC